MAATFYTLLTNQGQAAIANATALNTPVNLTKMAVGDGGGSPVTPKETQTALVSQKYSANLNSLKIDPQNPNYLIAEMIVPTTVGGWTVREVGIFDAAGNLFAVGNFPETYKPQLSEGSGRDLVINIVIQVSNAGAVTLQVDPAVTLASQSWVITNYVSKTQLAGGGPGQVLSKKTSADNDYGWQDLPSASITQKGVVQLEDGTSSTSTTKAATANAVKKSFDETAKKALLAGSVTQTFLVAAPTLGNHAVNLDKLNSSLLAKAALNGDPNQDFQVRNSGATANAVNNERLNFVLQSYALAGGNVNQTFGVADASGGGHAVNLNQLNTRLSQKADVAGNQFTQFSVGGATAAAHAVRLDQFKGGSNGNGAWTLLPGGGQYCRANINLAANASTTWTYPAVFVAPPAVFVTAINGAFQCWLNGIGAANCAIYNNGPALNVNLLAIW